MTSSAFPRGNMLGNKLGSPSFGQANHSAAVTPMPSISQKLRGFNFAQTISLAGQRLRAESRSALTLRAV